MSAEITVTTTGVGVTLSTGTVTSITAGAGLTGGVITTSGTIAVDFAPDGAGTATQVPGATDSRLSNSRTPTAHAASHGVAGADPVQLAISQVTNLATTLAGKLDNTVTVTAGTGLLGGGLVSGNPVISADIAPSGGGTANQLVGATDLRLSNTRTPTSHATTHGPLGSDPIPAGGLAQTQVANLVADLAAKIDATRQVIAGTGLTGGGDLSADRTFAVDFAPSGGGGAGQAVEATDSRLSDGRAPSGAAGGDLSGTYPNPTVSKFANVQIDTAFPTTGDVWSFSGTQWNHVAQSTLSTNAAAISGVPVDPSAPISGDILVYSGTQWVHVPPTSVPTNASLIAYNYPATGSATRTGQEKWSEVLSIKDFGAVGDGTLHTVTEWFTPASPYYRGYADLPAVQIDYPFVTNGSYSSDLAAINKAILVFSQSRLSPPAAGGSSLTGWGIGHITIPRGTYIINDKIYVSNGVLGNTTSLSWIGLKFTGDGMWASNLIYTLSSGDMFDISVSLNVIFQDLTFINETSAPRNTWTSTLFRLDPVGGGKYLQLDRCFARNFNEMIHLEDNVNADTNKINNCWFEDCNTFLYSRNSQAIINEINSSTFYGSMLRVFDIAGFGYTTINNCDFVQSGTVLHLAFQALRTGQASQYTLINTKMEFWPQPSNGTTKIVVVEDNVDNQVHVRMIGCGIAGGSPDPAIYQWEINGGNVTVDVNGGQWDLTKIQTKAQLGRSPIASGWMRFANCVETPSTTIDRVQNLVDGLCQHIPITFKNCKNVADICLKGPGTLYNCSAPASGSDDRNFVSKNANGLLAGGGAVFPTGATTHAISTSGQTVLVDRIRIVATAQTAGITEVRLEAFSDAGLTAQIGSTVTKTSGFTPPFSMEISVPADTFVTNGVWVRVWQDNPNISLLGTVFVDTISV